MDDGWHDAPPTGDVKDKIREFHLEQDRNATTELVRSASGDRAVVVYCKSESEWLATRIGGVGSSEVAALFGMCPESWAHGTPLKLYAHKTGVAPPVDETDAMLLGKLQEPVVARLTELKLPGIRVQAPPPWTVFRLRSDPRVMASIDRLTIEEDGVRVLELKTADFFAGEAWRDEDDEPCVPMHYQLQVQAQMHVLGIKRARLAAMVGRTFLPPFQIEYEPEVGAEIERRIAAFWKCVEERRPPEAGDRDFEAVAWIHPDGKKGKVVNLAAEAKELVADWDEQRRIKKEAERRILAIKTMVGELMQDAEVANVGGGRKVHWGNQRKVTRAHPVIHETLALLCGVRDGTITLENDATLDELITVLTEAAKDKVWTGRVMQPPYLKID